MSIEPKESRFQTDDGLQLYVKKWLVPDGTPLRAKILFNHGFSEHMDAYDHFFPDFAARGYEIIGYDQRGAGHTSPLKKNFGNTNEYFVFNDLEELLASEIEGYNGKFFMWGHSMGGAITLNYAVKGKKRERIDGYLANSPLIEVHPKTQPNSLLLAIGPFIAKVYPKFKYKAHINLDDLTDDKARVDEYRKDPLRLNYTTAEQAMGFLDRGKRLLSSVFVDKFVDKPVLVSHGTEDYINNYESSKKFFSLLKVSDKEFKSYPGAPHELTNLTKEKREKHRDDLLEWLDKHTEGAEEQEPAVVAEEAPKETDEEVAAVGEEPVVATEEGPKEADEEVVAASEEEPVSASEEIPREADEEAVVATEQPATADESVKEVDEPAATTESVDVEEPAKATEPELVETAKSEDPSEPIEEPVQVVEETAEEPAKDVELVEESSKAEVNDAVEESANAEEAAGGEVSEEATESPESRESSPTPTGAPKKSNKKKNKKKKGKK